MTQPIFPRHQVQYPALTEPIVPAAAPPFDPSGGFPWVRSPDFARKATLAVALIASSGWVGPIEPPAAPAFDPANGFPYPTYADRVDAPAPLVPEGLAARPEIEPSSIPPPELSWAPSFADFARQLAPLTHEGYARPDLEPSAISPPDLAWSPDYPDFARQLAPLAPEGLSARPEIEPAAIPPPVLSWAPTFADFARTAPQPVERDRHAAPIEPQPDPFDPSGGFPWVRSPDFARAAAPLVPEGLTARPELEPSAIPPPALSWAPTFADFARTAPQPVERDRHAAPVEPQPDPFDPSSGFPWVRQPDFARQLARSVDVGQSVRPEIDPQDIPPPALSWAPSYPAFARALPPLVPEGESARPEIEPAAIPPPLGSWAPSFPDFARAPQPLTEAVRIAAPVEPPGVAFDPSTGFPWVRSPDFARQGRQLTLAAFGSTVEPIPTPPAPELSWAPTFPAFVLRAHLGAHQQMVGGWRFEVPAVSIVNNAIVFADDVSDGAVFADDINDGEVTV